MVKLIGEIGINHNGNLSMVYDLINRFSFLDVIKMQKLEPKVSIPPERYNAPHPVPKNSFGDTYGQHKEFLEFNIEQYLQIKGYIESKGMTYASSVFDEKAAADVISTNPKYIKIPSARCNDFKLIKFIADNYKGPIHISTGMTTKLERQAIEDFFKNNDLENELVLYECTSDYYDDGDVYLSRYEAFSCHVPDIFYAKAAILNGAKYIEYHITLDRAQKGTDHNISLLPEEFLALKHWVERNKFRLDRIKIGKPDNLPANELEFRNKLWKSSII